jgi:hypothetical protein
VTPAAKSTLRVRLVVSAVLKVEATLFAVVAATAYIPPIVAIAIITPEAIFDMGEEYRQHRTVSVRPRTQRSPPAAVQCS